MNTGLLGGAGQQSAFHDYVDGKPVFQHPEVCDLVTGIFNNRPPQPRYMFA